MAYQVRRITEMEQLKTCDEFQIDHYQWTDGNKPKAYGRMALLKDYGFVIAMHAVETDPLCTYTEADDPVYRDSALEAFLNFAPGQIAPHYLNFEMNANGALLSQFGTTSARQSLASLSAFKASCEATMEDNEWNVILKIPMELVCSMYEIKPLQPGDSFTCNFYKICETSELEHYASYAPINSNRPNFHLPEFFAQAIIVE